MNQKEIADTAEVYIASLVEKWLGCPVERNAKAVLSEGEHIDHIFIPKGTELSVRYMLTLDQ